MPNGWHTGVFLPCNDLSRIVPWRGTVCTITWYEVYHAVVRSFSTNFLPSHFINILVEHYWIRESVTYKPLFDDLLVPWCQWFLTVVITIILCVSECPFHRLFHVHLFRGREVVGDMREAVGHTYDTVWAEVRTLILMSLVSA